ncbi:MAG: ROK family protein [Treponema sp.]|nr:ROK family protein [Treponema sp.]
MKIDAAGSSAAKSNDIFIGVDIGGTKTAICAGSKTGQVFEKNVFPTDKNPATAQDNILSACNFLFEKYTGTAAGGNPGNSGGKIAAIGVSCGGPLDAGLGIIQSPPNLPGWDNVPIVEMLRRRFSVPAFIENDANACALAEYLYGAGRGCANMVFLTFGTGLGAGLILDGKLYRGSSGLAGEAGHIRMSKDGPAGYGKHGALEGWCSGGGLSEAYNDTFGERISGGEVCIRAEGGDAKALKIIEKSAQMLGYFLAAVIDFINPDRIIIGSIFVRSEKLFRACLEKIIAAECLPQTAAVCKVLPAALGENLGDVAALSAAANGIGFLGK